MNNKKPAIKKSPVKKNSVGKKVVNTQNDNDDNTKPVKIPSVFVKKNLDQNTQITDSTNGTLMADAYNVNKNNNSDNIKEDNLTELDKYLTEKSKAVNTLMEKINSFSNKIVTNDASNNSLNVSPKISPKASPNASPKISHNIEFKGNPPVTPPSNWGDEELDDAEAGEVVDEKLTVVEDASSGVTGLPNPDDMEIDTEEDNYPDQAQLEEYNKEDFEQDKNMNINGILYEDYKKLPHQKQVNSVQCSYCQKFYSTTQQPKMFTTEFAEGEPVCFHCIFWTNYDPATRPHVDGVYGMTIVEYIMECKDFHDKTTCIKNSDAGGCLLCDYLNGVPIENVLGADVLINEQPIPEPLEDDKDYLQTVDCSFVITI